jgi:peptidyl-prolyl cis-trans isomerase B (cyclophilin B)
MTPLRRALGVTVIAATLPVSGATSADQGGAPPGFLAAPVDRETLERVLLAADRVIFDRLYSSGQTWHSLVVPPTRSSGPPPTRSPDERLLLDAIRSSSAGLRAAGVRAIGRLENPADVPLLAGLLTDRAIAVRREAVNAIAQVLRDPDAPGAVDGAAHAVQALFGALGGERDLAARGAILMALGEIRFADKDAQIVERLLAASSTAVGSASAVSESSGGESLPALVEFIRHNPAHSITAETRLGLRKLAAPLLAAPPLAAPPSLPALEALVLARDDDAAVIRRALTYRCIGGPDCGWPVRRAGLQLLRVPRTEFTRELNALLGDPSFRVRIQALRVFDSDPDAATRCYPISGALTDASPHVVIEALSHLRPTCAEAEDVAKTLERMARDLDEQHWQVPAAALGTLARFAPEAARKLANETAAGFKVWQVRAEAARVAAVVKDDALAATLAGDEEPNVRTEALKALYEIRSPRLSAAIVDALDSKDHQLVLVAAALLKLESSGQTALSKVLGALKRLTVAKNPTSREARLELLARIRQFGPGGALHLELRPFIEDFDPAVAIAAADTMGVLTGSRPNPIITLPSNVIDPETNLSERVSDCFRVHLSTGHRFEMRTDSREAPYTAGMFRRFVKQGYYDGLTFHRVMPMSFIEGGSPAANYYSGAELLRDEIGFNRPRRGAIGLSRHDRHTGNMQFFVSLMDSPELDRQFTVFGHVDACYPPNPELAQWMMQLDGLQAGARILRIEQVLPR